MNIEGSINVNDYVEEKTARKLHNLRKRGVRRKANVSSIGGATETYRTMPTKPVVTKAVQPAPAATG